jgi:hypothetical protein
MSFISKKLFGGATAFPSSSQQTSIKGIKILEVLKTKIGCSKKN